MPRQRNNYKRNTHEFPADFPERLKRFQVESGLSWAELNRRLDTDPETVRRWRDKGVRPSVQHYVALLKVAGSLGLGHPLTERCRLRPRRRVLSRKPVWMPESRLTAAARASLGDGVGPT